LHQISADVGALPPQPESASVATTIDATISFRIRFPTKNDEPY